MKPWKFVACTLFAVAVTPAAGCADGTGQALTPTLPTTDTNAANQDGTRLKASAPQPLSPQSAVRITNLTPQLLLRNGAGTFDSSVPLSYVFEVFDVSGSTQTLVVKSDPIAAGNPQTVWTVPNDLLKVNKTYAWRAYAIYNGVNGSLSDGVSFRTPVAASSRRAGSVRKQCWPRSSCSAWAMRILPISSAPRKATVASNAARTTWRSSATASSRRAFAKDSISPQLQARHARYQSRLPRVAPSWTS